MFPPPPPSLQMNYTYELSDISKWSSTETSFKLVRKERGREGKGGRKERVGERGRREVMYVVPIPVLMVLVLRICSYVVCTSADS